MTPPDKSLRAMPALITGALILLNTACSPLRSATGIQTCPQQNAHLFINKSVTVPPGKTRIFFQQGEIKADFDHYQPNCNLEVRKLDNETSQIISIGKYKITGIQETEDEIVRFNPGTRIKLALNGIAIANADDSLSSIYAGLHFWLEGPNPNVMRLSCRGSYAAPDEATLPTQDEIRQALGKWISIQPDSTP